MNSKKKDPYLILVARGGVFLVQSFMTQIETLFFGGAFTSLTTLNTTLIMLSGLFPVMTVSSLAVRLQKKDGSGTKIEFTEEVEVINPIMTLIIKSYLKKQQSTYIADLRKVMGK